ncbi:MAG: hypothetical protein Q9216_003276 [Gyalolechia sp. 2 TL-2023]
MSGSIFHDENNPPSPPPAPPLPPQRYSNRAASALARFAQPFIYASRPPSAHGDLPPEPSPSGIKSNTHRSSSPASRSTAHRTGLPINALDISPTRTHAILAGREILKTIRVTESACTEDFNLRSSIIAYAAAHDRTGGSISARHKDQLAATDVKWSHGKYDTTVATAAANGQIVIYDINRPGIELARLHEHSRQVHRVAFNPHQGALLLSGSQDATIRLWDLRALARHESVMTCQSLHKYPGNNEGVRDLRWSPTEGVEFAAGTDNGVVQRWDIQRPNVPLLKLNAHEKTCYSIDWHPDGKHLVSGGADKNVKVWDFSSSDRRMKACWQMRAPKSVFNVRWRPPIWKPEDATPGHWYSSQVATSYDDQDPRIHVWDLRRPSVPSKELDRSENAPTALLWHSENLLWSVNIAGNFTQTNIGLIEKLSDKRSPSTVAIAPDGRMASFLEKRSRNRLSAGQLGHNLVQRSRRPGSGGEKLSSSYSATDGSFEEGSLLSSSFKARRRKTPSTQSSRSLASTPPSAGSGGPVVPLDQALQRENLFHPAQLAACGRISGVFEANTFVFLACRYQLRTPPWSKSGGAILRLLHEALIRNADLAAYTGQHRLAQSWRIIALALQKELKARADRRLAHRTLRSSHLSTDQPESKTAKRNDESYTINGARPELGRHPTKQLASAPMESGSNITTPLARPVSHAATGSVQSANHDDLAEKTSFALPEPRFTKRSPQKPTETISALSRLKSPNKYNDSDQSDGLVGTFPSHQGESGQILEHESPDSGFHDIDRYMSEQRAAMENYRANSRPLLRLGDSMQTTGNISLAPRFDRHDSNESFQMFSASTDSSHRAISMGGSFDSSLHTQRSDVNGQRWSENQESSKISDDAGRLSAVDDLRDTQPCKDMAGPSGDPTRINVATPADDRAIERPTSRTRIVNLEDTVVRDSSPDSILKDESRKDVEREEDIYVESDFLPSPEDPLPVPWTATAMLLPLIDYHLEQLSDVQLPAHLLLLLGPYIEHHIAVAVQTSIFLSYHNQLISLSLYTQAAQLRKTVPAQYAEIAEHGTYGINIGGPWCTSCNKSSKGDRRGFCARCQEYWGNCPICEGEGPVAIMQGLSTDETTVAAKSSPQSDDHSWVWCQDCGHGGHVGCLRVWWDDVEASEGGCPTLGCLHDCVAGTRRAAFLQRKAEDKKASTVKGDAWVVGESRAVEKTRGLIRGNEKDTTAVQDRSHTRSPKRSRGSLSMASMGRTGSGGKKVRLVVPEMKPDVVSGDGFRGEQRTRASAPS